MISFDSTIMVPTHRLTDSDAYDKSPSVVELIDTKKYSAYLVEITADGFLVHGGQITGAKNDFVKPEPPSVKVEEKPFKPKAPVVGVGRKGKK